MLAAAPLARPTATRSAAPKRVAERGASFSPRARWIPRAAVLTGLAIATIAVPLSAGADGGSGREVVASGAAAKDAGAGVSVESLAGPSTLEVVGNATVDATPPPSIAQVIPEDQRTVQAASRSADRSDVDGCDTEMDAVGTNGNLDTSTLCELWGTGHMLQADAAVALTGLNEAYVAEYGVNMCLTDSYRTLSTQYTLKGQKGRFAAKPGTSQHGWGLAIDICGESYKASDKWDWLKKNGPLFGWDNPPWARAGGSGAYEPWHWEYTEGVAAQKTAR